MPAIPVQFRSWKLRLHFLKGEHLAGAVDFDRVAFVEFSGDDFRRQLVFQPLLDDPLERPGAERDVVALIHELIFGGIGELDGQVAVFEPGRQIL